MRDAPNLNLAWTSLAAEECRRLGVRHAVISPGSRSAPLAVAFARHGGIAVHVAHDERAGAFMALGIAQSSGVPAVAVMTSGTAVANVLPAAVEARVSRVPILVFAADRPPELRDCGANQSIPQAGLLDGAVRWSADVPCPSTEIPAEFVLSTVDEAFARACGIGSGLAGAVHLNWQFREPLAPEERAWDRAWLGSVARWSRGRSPWRRTAAASRRSAWRSGSRGSHAPPSPWARAIPATIRTTGRKRRSQAPPCSRPAARWRRTRDGRARCGRPSVPRRGRCPPSAR
jgi:2-succinyl-5-enolpyruvyl-6-hydroxy-3-cyclohexene-1-carboxylate synthase